MKTLLEWRLERLWREFAPVGDMGVNGDTAGNGGTDHIDPNVLRILSKVVPQVRAEFQDEQDAIEAIALACIFALNELGRTESIEKIKRTLEAQSPRGSLMTGVPKARTPQSQIGQ